MPPEEERPDTQQTNEQALAEQRIYETNRNSKTLQDFVNIRTTPPEQVSDQVHSRPAAMAGQEQNAGAAPLAVLDVQGDRMKQMKTVKAADRQQLNYQLLNTKEQAAARTPHGGAVLLSEQQDNKSSTNNNQHLTESQKMSSEMTQMNQLNLSLLSKKQEEFRDQFKEHKSYVRFRYPNIEINDKDKLETAYGAAAMRNVVRSHKGGGSKGSQSTSRDRSRDAPRQEAAYLGSIPLQQQNTQIHAMETSVNTMNQSSVLFEDRARKISFHLRGNLQPKTFQPPTAGPSGKLSYQTTATGFHKANSQKQHKKGSISQLARMSARAPDLGALETMDHAQRILNVVVPQKQGEQPHLQEHVAHQQQQATKNCSMPEIKTQHGRQNTEVVLPLQKSNRAKNMTQLKSQTVEKKAKFKSKLERNKVGPVISKTLNNQGQKKGALDVKDQKKLDSFRSKLSKFDQMDRQSSSKVDSYPQYQQQQSPKQESSLDRYYRLYVEDGPDSIKNTQQPYYTEKFKQQLAFTLEKRLNVGRVELNQVTKEGYRRAMNEINKVNSVQDALSLAQQSSEVRAVLQTHKQGCDCPYHQNKIMEQRLEKKGSGMLSKNSNINKSASVDNSGSPEQQQPGDKDQLFSFLTMRRPCCRKSCSTTHNPMLHHKRFNQEFKGQMPETDPKKIEKAVKKAEKEEKKKKLDMLSSGLMNLLQEKQDQLNASQALHASMSMDEDSQNMNISQYHLKENTCDSPILKLQEVKSGPTLEIESAKLRKKANQSSSKMLQKSSGKLRKAQMAAKTDYIHQKSKSLIDTAPKQRQSGEIINTRQSREIVSFPQVEIIQVRERPRRSASKEVLSARMPKTKKSGVRRRPNDDNGLMINVESSRSMESYVEREVQEIMSNHRRSNIVNDSSRFENSHQQTPRSSVRFDLPHKKIKQKERAEKKPPQSPGSRSDSKASKLSNHGDKLTKLLKGSLRKKVLDNQRNSQSTDRDDKGKDTKKKAKKKKDQARPSTPKTPAKVVDDEPKTYERIKYEEELAREKNKQEKLRQDMQKIKDALALRFTQTLQNKLPFFKQKDSNNDDLSLTLEKNKSIDGMMESSLEIPKGKLQLPPSESRGMEMSKDDIVNIGKQSSKQGSNQQTLEAKFETTEASPALSKSPSLKSALSEKTKVQSILFKKLMGMVEQAEDKNTTILTELECKNFSKVLKEESLRAQVTSKQRVLMIKKVMKTLDSLMTPLMLQEEFKAITETIKKEQNADKAEKRVRIVPKDFMEERESERLIKLLVRCMQMHEAKEKTMKILARAKNREELMANFLETMGETEADEVRDNYQVLLRMSAKLYNQIETLRRDTSLLNRPFMWQGENLQTTLVKQVIDVRAQILSTHPKVRKEMVSQVLDKTGRIVECAVLLERQKQEAAAELARQLQIKMKKAAKAKEQKEKKERLLNRALGTSKK